MYVDYQHNDLSNADAGLSENLQEALNFDEDDLEINKTGKISTPQMTRLVIRALGPFLGLIGAALGLGALCMALWMGGPLAAFGLKMTRIFGKYLIMGIGALFFGVIALIMKLLLASGNIALLIVDLMEDKVATVTGRMNTSESEEIEDGLSTITRQKTHKWNCVIKGEYFEITEEAFELLQDRSGSNYTAYVAPRSRFMIAIEQAGPDPNARDPFKLEYKTNP